MKTKTIRGMSNNSQVPTASFRKDFKGYKIFELLQYRGNRVTFCVH